MNADSENKILNFACGLTFNIIRGVAGIFAIPFIAYTNACNRRLRWLQTTYLTLNPERLPAAFERLRIVQFSDVHLGLQFTAAHLSRLAERIEAQQADLICFTGDLYDRAIEEAESCIQILSGLSAPLGKWAVLGNHDYIAGADRIAALLKQAGFRVLVNASAPVERGGSRIWMVGVDDMWRGKPDLQQALAGVPREECKLLLSHAPDFADIALKHSVDLQLSGHTHGGQVRLPFIGHLVTTRLGVESFTCTPIAASA